MPAKFFLEDNFRCFEARLNFLLSCMKWQFEQASVFNVSL